MTAWRSLLPLLALGAAIAGAATLPLPARSQSPSFSPAQKDAIGQIVKDYLMAHPEVVQDALVALDKRQKDAQTNAAKAAIKTEAKSIYDAKDAMVVGDPKGDVTLVEFFDYNCPYCRKAMTTIDALMKQDPKLRVLLRDLPIVHPPESLEVAKIALAARNQLPEDKLWDFHKSLFSGSHLMAKPQALQVAKDFGLDTARLEKDAESPRIKATLAETDRLSQVLDLRGTPAFVLGDNIIFGAQDDAEMKAQIAAFRQCGKTAC